MKRTLVLLLGAWTMMSLACLSTLAQSPASAISTPTGFTFLTEIDSGEVYEIPDRYTPWARETCRAIVLADALHLREEANPRARVITWLRRGDVVEVINCDNAEWWRVRYEFYNGYVHSKYLAKVECEK